jgi:ribosomal-protein-alanine N-acetyltransferase
MIRLADENDVDEIIDISIDVFGIESCFTEYYYIELIGQSKSYVIIDDNKIVGFSLNKLKEKSIGISMIAVREEYRSKGFGTMLLKQLINENKNTCRLFYLMVDVENSGAIKLYKSIGFRIDGIRNRYYENGNDGYYMTLDGF